jgi:hypothetical protein
MLSCYLPPHYTSTCNSHTEHRLHTRSLHHMHGVTGYYWMRFLCLSGVLKPHSFCNPEVSYLHRSGSIPSCETKTEHCFGSVDKVVIYTAVFPRMTLHECHAVILSLNSYFVCIITSCYDPLIAKQLSSVHIWPSDLISVQWCLKKVHTSKLCQYNSCCCCKLVSHIWKLCISHSYCSVQSIITRCPILSPVSTLKSAACIYFKANAVSECINSVDNYKIWMFIFIGFSNPTIYISFETTTPPKKTQTHTCIHTQLLSLSLSAL